jgi:RNA polymerase sigma-70 factor (ECF subfamily)
MGPAEEASLVARLRRGEAAALTQVYGLYSQRLFRFLVRLAQHPQVAEDLHQETWVAAARNSSRLAVDTDLAAWLFTIARNKHLSWCRGLAAEARRTEGMEPEAVPAPDRAVNVRRDLERALAGLPEIHREVLLLMGCEGLEAERAAAVLGLSVEAVRQRLSRARAALAQALEAPAKIVPIRKETA